MGIERNSFLIGESRLIFSWFPRVESHSWWKTWLFFLALFILEQRTSPISLSNNKMAILKFLKASLRDSHKMSAKDQHSSNGWEISLRARIRWLIGCLELAGSDWKYPCSFKISCYGFVRNNGLTYTLGMLQTLDHPSYPCSQRNILSTTWMLVSC